MKEKAHEKESRNPAKCESHPLHSIPCPVCAQEKTGPTSALLGELPATVQACIASNVAGHERVAAQIISASKRDSLHPDYIMSLLMKVKAFAEGHFVYKSGLHGKKYINKEEFGCLGATELNDILLAVASKAFMEGGLHFKKGKKITVLGPAYGAIHYTMPICVYLEKAFAGPGGIPEVFFRPGRTQLRPKKDNPKVDEHYFPEKLIDAYMDTDEFMIIDDITNIGSTNREVGSLCHRTFGIPVTRAMCIVSRGGQTAESMGLKEFYPFFDIVMDQYDPRTESGLTKINELGPINTVLGKGAKWVDTYGQGPYPIGTDFSSYEFTVPIQEW